MTEGLYTERRDVLEKAIKAAKGLGISDPSTRREAVIDAKSAQAKGILPSNITAEQVEYFPSVASPEIRDESIWTRERAIKKYLEIEKGVPRVPIIVECLHSDAPTEEEIGDNADFKSKHEPGTLEISRKVASLTGATLIRAKQSRLKSDMNRRWDNREFVGPHTEYPRSARAALYWGVRQVLKDQGRLDKNEELTSAVTRISIHGMKDNSEFSFAIAGSNSPGDEEVLEGFRSRLEFGLRELGINDNVVIAKKEDKNQRPYSGLPNLAHFRRSPKEGPNYQHPAFGEKFQTIQLEIASKFRKEGMRDNIAAAIAYALVKND